MPDSKYTESLPKVLALYQQGSSIKSISQQIGVRDSTVARWLEKSGHYQITHNRKHREPSGEPMESALTPEQCSEAHLFLVVAQWLHKKDRTNFSENLCNLMRNWDAVKTQLVSGKFGVNKKKGDSLA
ncbi:hypothetical protein CEB3_c19210 [Peptococcaceae bacterium CEB3]|nr:hypothetical protein CEB3_c19210 [Peptococcaceae bacterium CEB3]